MRTMRRWPARRAEQAPPLLQCERQLDRYSDGNRLSVFRARLELPLLGGFDGFFVEAVGRVERADDLDVADVAVFLNDRLDDNGAFDMRVLGFLRVLGLHFPYQLRQRHTVARSVGVLRAHARASERRSDREQTNQ